MTLTLAEIITDEEIAELIAEHKVLPADWAARARRLKKRGHTQQRIDCLGEAGSEFRIITRQSQQNPFDFSVILAYKVPQSNRLFRLRR